MPRTQTSEAEAPVAALSPPHARRAAWVCHEVMRELQGLVSDGLLSADHTADLVCRLIVSLQEQAHVNGSYH